ncbi:glycosyltransferase [Paraclostridium bifermentans]|uniref:glycosyltransferase n=1 Tax=Paraclostridium bifermentans TaxID=1490 RepID=UPI000A170249|nr:glycosyltransferase [Paraclostridium bifermentans]OSB10699.1 glycosyltransferase [Paraclostridium bifermentans]
MRILHYSLGIPPYRTGGLTKYCTDLMEKQTQFRNKVVLLFPGKMNVLDNKLKIKFYKNYKNIEVYEVINPLPVPLLNGISDPNKFMQSCDKNIFIKFIQSINVDIVHIHTFMGLHTEFLEACKDLGLKIVFTTHDYYGICPKVNLIDYEGCICNKIDFEKCAICNKSGYSINLIRILQSNLYRNLKSKGLIGKFKKNLCLIRNTQKNTKKQDLDVNKFTSKEKYSELSNYYNKMYTYIDFFFFNSSLAKEIYNKYVDVKGDVISITHNGILDNRTIKNYTNNRKLKLTYLGPYKEYKGFSLIITAIKELYNEGHRNIILTTYGDTKYDEFSCENININGKYNYNELKSIFTNTDVLVVPSIWNETFGFIVLEALSYGTPVLLTDCVGSKDLIYKNELYKGEIIKPSKESIKERILYFEENRDKLEAFNHNILNDKFEYTLEIHCQNICNEYKKILED